MFGLERHLGLLEDVQTQFAVDVVDLLVGLLLGLALVALVGLQVGLEDVSEVHDAELLHGTDFGQVLHDELELGAHLGDAVVHLLGL